ncbi:MAG TPA: haloacid dehalogenase-like hydrolase [Caldithrix abyssi]|uniref:Haloacid dehalogenase-like hydrolase n=1 Tax=Caldithrix abyssi TaxID=187145 RepID=A0A7V4TZX3_CALAY|nr:haloacid dehalogenase-like hydrolase [Caldithrix abyssi]
MTQPYAAFFDLDNTIFNVNSGKLMVEHALENGLMKRKDILRVMLLSLGYRIGVISPEMIMAKVSGLLKGTPEEDMVRFSKRIFDEQLKTHIREDIVREIRRHRQNGGRVVILSASTAYMCIPVKEYLKMDDTVCSEMEVQNGLLTGRPRGAYCYGMEKVHRLRAYCEEHGFSIEETWYYGDSHSDIPVLEIVGHPVCVTPDKSLNKIAGKRGWNIIE